MVTLSAFADEISPDLNVQLDVLESEGIRHIELRGVWKKNVLELDDDELKQVKGELDRRGFRLSSIASPIGKVPVTGDFEEHLTALERAIQTAKFFEAAYIRVFSFFIPQGEDPARYRDEAVRRMGVLTERAQQAGVVLLHENEKEIYGDTGERCRDIHDACPSPHLRAAFDPANFVQCGVRPYQEAYPLLREKIEYVHIKDARFDGGQVVPAGQGDGEVRELLQALADRGYSGFVSLEPHLSSAGRFAGFSGPELFRTAAGALKALLEEVGQPWD